MYVAEKYVGGKGVGGERSSLWDDSRGKKWFAAFYKNFISSDVHLRIPFEWRAVMMTVHLVFFSEVIKTAVVSLIQVYIPVLGILYEVC